MDYTTKERFQPVGYGMLSQFFSDYFSDTGVWDRRHCARVTADDEFAFFVSEGVARAIRQLANKEPRKMHPHPSRRYLFKQDQIRQSLDLCGFLSRDEAFDRVALSLGNLKTDFGLTVKAEMVLGQSAKRHLAVSFTPDEDRTQQIDVLLEFEANPILRIEDRGEGIRLENLLFYPEWSDEIADTAACETIRLRHSPPGVHHRLMWWDGDKCRFAAMVCDWSRYYTNKYGETGTAHFWQYLTKYVFGFSEKESEGVEGMTCYELVWSTLLVGAASPSAETWRDQAIDMDACKKIAQRQFKKRLSDDDFIADYEIGADPRDSWAQPHPGVSEIINFFCRKYGDEEGFHLFSRFSNHILDRVY